MQQVEIVFRWIFATDASFCLVIGGCQLQHDKPDRERQFQPLTIYAQRTRKHADTVINVDLPWNPAVLEQRIAHATASPNA